MANRCSSENNGVQCGLPAGHSGMHQNGMAVPQWSDPKEKTVKTIMVEFREVIVSLPGKCEGCGKKLASGDHAFVKVKSMERRCEECFAKIEVKPIEGMPC